MNKPVNHESNRLLKFIIEILFYGLITSLLLYYYKDFVYKVQDLSLFLTTKAFFLENISAEGGLLTYCALFLTQFFYYPVVGIIIYMVLLVLLQQFICYSFSLKNERRIYSLFPIAFLVTTLTILGYIIIVLKNPEYVFTPLLGVGISLGIYNITKNCEGFMKRILMFLLITFAGYFVAGFYIFFGLLLSIIHYALTEKENVKKLRDVVLYGALMIPAPLTYYLLFKKINLIYALYYPLPLFRPAKEEIMLWIPYMMLFASLIILTVLKDKSFNPEKKSRKVIHNLVVLGSFFAIVYLLSYRNEAFLTELKIDKAIEENRWSDVITYTKDMKSENTRKIVLSKNLAMFKLGVAGDRMFSISEGKSLPESYRGIILAELCGKPIYYHYGRLNFCYRWCMEDAVEYGWKNEYLKYMAKCSMLSGEKELSEKYIKTLSNTLFYKDYARELKGYIDNPETVKNNREFADVLNLCTFDNELAGDESKLELYLLNSFADLTRGNDQLSELSLISSIIIKDIDKFWPRFFYFYNKRQGKNIPRHYQEAAILFANLEKKVDITKFNISDNVKSRFDAFMKMTGYYDVSDTDKIKPNFQKGFGDTYWFFYFFENDIKTY